MNPLPNVLPFYNLTNDQFILTISDTQSNFLFSNDSNHNSIDSINRIKFDQFNFNSEVEVDQVEVNINNDPNLNFFSSYLDISDLTKYAFDDNINCIQSNIDKNSLSICSFNINSLSKNLDEFKYNYLQENKFNILSFVETKITEDIKHLFDI